MNDVLVRIAHGLVIGVLVLFLLGPVALVIVLSFSADPFINFPPEAWGLRQYRAMIESGTWRTAMLHSVEIALVVTLLVTAIGIAAVLGLERSRVPGRRVLQAVAIGPLIVPGVVYAIGAYQTFVDLGLAGTMPAFVLAHAVLATPLFLIIGSVAVMRVPAELELAAMSLGAGRLRASYDVTLRLIGPALAGGALLVFAASLNEVVVSSFLADVSFTTLPVEIFASLRIAVDPVVMAISASLAFLCAAVATTAYLFRRRLR